MQSKLPTGTPGLEKIPTGLCFAEREDRRLRISIISALPFGCNQNTRMQGGRRVRPIADRRLYVMGREKGQEICHLARKFTRLLLEYSPWFRPRRAPRIP